MSSFIVSKNLAVFGLFLLILTSSPGQSTAVPADATVSGRVLSETDSQPVSGALVVIEPEGAPQYVAGGYAAADGTFSIVTRWARKYRVVLEKPGFLDVSTVIEAAPNAESALATPRPLLDQILLRMVPQAVVSGRVTNSADQSLMGALVQLSQVQIVNGQPVMSVATQVATNDMGEYRVFGIKPGMYYVSASYQDMAGALGLRFRPDTARGGPDLTEDFALTYFPGVLDPIAARPVKLNGGQVTSNIDIRIETTPSVSVSGTVLGVPADASSFMVILQPAGVGRLGSHRMYQLSAQRHDFFFKSVPPGEYVLRAEFRTANGSLSAREPISVGRSSGKAILQLQSPFPIVGTVSFDGPSAVESGFKLSLEGVDRHSIAPLEPDSNGRFTALLPGPDSYSLRITDKSQSVLLKSIVVDERPVGRGTFTLSHSNQQLRIILGSLAGEISGTTISGKKTASGDRLVVLLSTEQRNPELYATAVGPEGNFEFKPLPSGKYRLSCFSDLHSAKEVTWDVIDNVKARGTDISIEEGEKRHFEIDACETSLF